LKPAFFDHSIDGRRYRQRCLMSDSSQITDAVVPAADAPTAVAQNRLTIRKLEIDLANGFDRHWFGGDAFMSQYHNALSMSFPVGEQSFIDSVRDCVKLLPASPEHDALRETAAQFIGQEATHRHLHGLYNAQLERQGLVNHWAVWATRRIRLGHRLNVAPRHFLTVTAAYEHITAVMASYLLRHAFLMDKADPRLATLWLWHAAEETEHRAVAFDLYRALGGNYAWRIRWYLQALLLFGFDMVRQTAINLWHDGTLFRPSTWWSAARFAAGRHGAIWHVTGPLLAYFRRDFHPDQESHADPEQTSQGLARRWLASHADRFRVVRSTR
jgi:uncharacterized protein